VRPLTRRHSCSKGTSVNRFEVVLRDFYREHNRIYLRYAIINHSRHEYLPTRPAVWRLTGVRSPQSLIPFRERQIGERIVRSLKARSSTPMDVIDASTSSMVGTGSHGSGWLVVDGMNMPATTDVSLLRIEFAADIRGTVEAVLVLPAWTDKQEVANARIGQ
jgi:hypothetical protein